MIPATTLAAKSDIGILHQIPADPQQRGSRMMLGSKNNNCRVNDRKMALPAMPPKSVLVQERFLSQSFVQRRMERI